MGVWFRLRTVSWGGRDEFGELERQVRRYGARAARNTWMGRVTPFSSTGPTWSKRTPTAEHKSTVA